MTIDNIFDVDCDNVHMVQIDAFEAVEPRKDRIRHGQFATEKQLNFLKSLFAQRTGNEEARIIRMHLLSEHRAGRLSVSMASEAITDVMALPRDVRVSKDAQTYHEQNYDHGQIWISTSGEFVRIKENQAGTTFYGLVWDGSGKWNYTTGILRSLDHRITAAEASAWGHEHQFCIFCSRNLSDPRSEFAGYGETCARNNDLPWGSISVDEVPPPVIDEWTGEDLSYTPSIEGSSPYEEGTCGVCRQPRPFVLNGYLRGCNC